MNIFMHRRGLIRNHPKYIQTHTLIPSFSHTASTDVPWFHSTFNDFSLSLVCVQKTYCIDFYVSFSLFAGNLSKDERESF